MRGQRGFTARSALCCIALLGAACAEPTPPNLLLISVDTLRADHVTAYGYPLATTPNIDGLAAEGVLFEDVIAPRGATWPALTTLLSSLPPRVHGVRDNGVAIPDDVRVLPAHLSGLGYETVAFLTNMPEAGNRFDESSFFEPPAKDRQATRAASAWLRSERAAPFFAWVHLMGPHQPYWDRATAPSPFDTGYRGPLDGSLATLQAIHRERRDLSPDEVAHIVSLYDADVSFVDQRVGELLAALDAAGLADDTLVVLVADHGEELYQHNHFFLHAYSVYQSVLHVPWIMRAPDRVPAGVRVDGVTALEDVAPTLLDLMGLPAASEFAGRSLADRVSGRRPRDLERAVFSELGRDIYSVRTDRWHYVHNPRGRTSPGSQADDDGALGHFRFETDELYDVARDPLEHRNVSSQHPDVVKALRERLEARLARLPDRFEQVKLSPERRHMLEQLGYIE